MRPNRLFGSDMVNVSLEIVTRRSAPAILLPALRNAARTESNSPNNKNAAITDSKVNSVRVLRLNRAAQTRWKYFMQAPLRAPRSLPAARPACPYRGAAHGLRIRLPLDRA